MKNEENIDLVLIRPNDQKNVYGETTSMAACEPPFWIATIVSYVKKHGITNIEVIDAEAINGDPNETAKKVKELDPKLVGIIVTGTNLSASTQKMHGAGILAKEIKKQSDAPIFMWGLHPSSLPEHTLNTEEIDFVIKGEGLKSVFDLTQYFAWGGGKLCDIQGLYYFKDGELKYNNSINLTDINDMPKPDWTLLPMPKYHAHNWQRLKKSPEGRDGYGIIATTLGCPYNCEFCAISTLFGERRVRFKEPQKVIEEIDELVKKYGVYYIKIIDECFVLNKKYVEQVCDLLIKRNYDIDIWAYARVDTVDAEILKKLKKANINWLGIGIESADIKVLEKVSKGQYTLEKTKESMRLIHEAGINVIANFMFGLTYDTFETMEATLQLARDINPEFINMYCTMAYPGSKLYEECINNNIELPNSWLGYAQLSYECQPLPTKNLSAKEVLKFRDEAFNRFFDGNETYFSNIRAKFGKDGEDMIMDMLKSKLKRKLLGD